VAATILFPHTLDRRESACIIGSLASKISAGRYGAGRGRDRAGCTRGEERVVGSSAAGAAVGVAEAKQDARVTRGICRTLSLRAGSYGLDLSDDTPMKWRGFSPVRFYGSTM